VQEMNSLDWSEILQIIKSHATSLVAKEKVQKLSPLANQNLAKESVEEIFGAVSLIQMGLRPFMESLDLFEVWHSRIRKQAVLKTLELRDVRSFCLEAVALKEACGLLENSWSKGARDGLMNCDEPLSAIDQIMTPNGEIRSDASEKLFQLFREKESLSRQIENTLDRLVNAHQMQNLLQDKYVTTREGRWVLPIRSGMQHFTNGVIHGSSQTKQTVFMEPESIIPMNNRIRQIEVEIEEEVERLLIEISKYLFSLKDQFAETRNTLELTDICLAKAQWSQKVQAQEFSFSEGLIDLHEVRHPLLTLNKIGTNEKVIANSVQLNPQKSILLLSGPNAGGKTILLKSIGIAAQMARCGLPICAQPTSQIPFFKTICIGIGDSQSVDENLSTFAAHLKILNLAAQLKGQENLVLVDEICGSTDPEEGSSLARAFIERFAEKEVFAVITSHLGPLKTGWKEKDKILNGSMEYDSRTGRPTYQYLQGIAGDSLAIQTAQRVGVDQSLVDRALALLSPETRVRLSGAQEIERLKSDLQTLREHLKSETKRAQQEKEKYEKQVLLFEKEKEERLTKLMKSTEKKIEEQIQLTKAEQALKRHTALQEIRRELPEIIKSQPGSGSSSALQTAEDFGKRYPPGTKVFITHLGQDGLVQSLPNNKGEVMVLSNSMRLTLPWQELKPPDRAKNPTADLVRRSSSSGRVTVALVDADKTLDLRGKTVEEALSDLEIELDQAALQKEDRLKIIHGHGTDTLKKAIRTYLSRSTYVKKWKAGGADSGGDGVTWAEISDD
jgi:DNA mismatch repair protein MutS2